jgi:hypothetical protein
VLSALDVPELVRALRTQRKGLVETDRQYGFVFDALRDEIREGLRIERRLMPRGVALSALAGGGAPAVTAAQ